MKNRKEIMKKCWVFFNKNRVCKYTKIEIEYEVIKYLNTGEEETISGKDIVKEVECSI